MLSFFLTAAVFAADAGTFQDVKASLTAYCAACHKGKAAVAGFNVDKYATPQAVTADADRWGRALTRVRNHEMPPRNGKPMPLEARERMASWIDTTLHEAACSAGLRPGPVPLKRLNRAEYGATIRDLLNVHVNVGSTLPADGAGGEGFDNAAETLFLSPMHAEKYLDAAKQAMQYAAGDGRARKTIFPVEPGRDVTPEQAGRKAIEALLPRAFRRPATEVETARYVALFDAQLKTGASFDEAIRHAMSAVLISPHFLFRAVEPNPSAAPRLLGHYEMASRLSYFLWGTMPDQRLMDLAAKGQLQDPLVLRDLVAHMLPDQRTREFAEQFVEQWLDTRQLGREIKPDPALYPAFYDEEIAAAIRYEPYLFFQELLAHNMPLVNLIDSNFTILTNKLERHYGLKTGRRLRQQPDRVQLPEGSHRGGLLGMAAVHAVSSYPRRTSPVLRGKWILEAMLGTPPPPPPPNVPELKEHAGEKPATLRDRLLQHRANPVCAACHDRIDPLGFGLENFDVVGVWRDRDAGLPIDAKGELPDGTRFDGPEEMKRVLLEKRDVFIRNLTSKMLGYALGRGLTREDSCTVDLIVERLRKNEYRAYTLVEEIVLSVPFRYQPGSDRKLAVTED